MTATEFLMISPHFDDAVFSAGAWLTRHPGSVVATVCAYSPGINALGGWDRDHGFENGDQAIKVRTEEDLKALRILEADQLCLDFLDNEYRSERDMRPSLTSCIIQLIEDLQPSRLLFPLGAGHNDHECTSDASINAAVATGTVAIAYTDLPYALKVPGFPAKRIQVLRSRGLRVADYPTPEGDNDRKRTAAGFYVSQQIDTTGCFESHAERMHRIVPG